MCKFEIVIIIATIVIVVIVIVRVYSTSLEDRADDQKFLEKLNFIEIDDSLTSIDDLIDAFDKMNEEKTPQRKFEYLLQFHNHQISRMNADNLIPFIINQIVICKPSYFVSNVRYPILFPFIHFLKIYKEI